jgi:DNA replication protein DnaC
MTKEAVRLGDTEHLKSLQERLKARGIEVPAPPAERPPYVPEVESPEDVAERMAQANAHKAARWERRCPVLYADARADTLDSDQSPERLAAWANDRDALNLILAGSVGTGKTWAAYAIGWAMVGRGVFVEAWTVGDLLDALRPDGDRNEASYAERADVLILDDLGATRPTEWAVETLTALMDTRLREKRRTIVTTNLAEAIIASAWGDRLMDRLRHSSTVVVMSGPSRRGAGW